nr:carbohydrate porin [Rhizomicrobium palustre]
MDPAARGNETFDATLFAGLRLWRGAELYINPEIDQGFGLSNTVGVAGYVSGEAYKVGKSVPYGRLQRLFLRQSFDLGGEVQTIEDGANQIATTRSADNLVLTFGKISVGDIFDANDYAHDQHTDFLNWAVIDSGAFDYAADAWGYTYGGTAELTYGRWTWRAGLFNLSRVPNTTQLERDFSQFELVGEAEHRHTLWGHAGKVKLLGFVNRGRMGSYNDALANGLNMARVRRYASRPGFAINASQELSDDLGLFTRLSWNDGSKEAYEFTEINRALALGLSLKGNSWQRPEDTVGLAIAVHDISDAARRYLAAGGMGILIGDGRLDHAGSENLAEFYYAAHLTGWATLTADYQLVVNPAYNRDRGPLNVFSLRLHVQG